MDDKFVAEIDRAQVRNFVGRVDIDQAGIPLRGDPANYFFGSGISSGADDPGSWLDDSGLFRGNFREGMAQEIFVIESDLGDDGNFGNQDVGGIETAAKANLEDGDVGFLAGEKIEGHRGDAFKKCGMGGEIAGGEEVLDDFMNAGEGCGEVGIGYVSVSDCVEGAGGGHTVLVQMLRNGGIKKANALVDAHQVRRGVEAHAQSRGAQNAGQHHRGGTFSVGSGDVHGGNRALGISQAVGEDADVGEVEFSGAGVLGRG